MSEQDVTDIVVSTVIGLIVGAIVYVSTKSLGLYLLSVVATSFICMSLIKAGRNQ